MSALTVSHNDGVSAGDSQEFATHKFSVESVTISDSAQAERITFGLRSDEALSISVSTSKESNHSGNTIQGWLTEGDTILNWSLLGPGEDLDFIAEDWIRGTAIYKATLRLRNPAGQSVTATVTRQFRDQVSGRLFETQLVSGTMDSDSFVDVDLQPNLARSLGLQHRVLITNGGTTTRLLYVAIVGWHSRPTNLPAYENV